MKFRDVEKIYKINDNQEETAQDAVSSSASFGTKKTFAEMGKERERAVSARAGEIQRELKSFNEQYGALAEAFNSRTRTDDELRRDWEVLRPMGEALSEEIASSGLFDSESATGVRDALGEMISSFSEAVKPPKVPEYDIGSLGMLDELGERENARAAASRILALGATGEDAQKARDVLRQTDAPGTIDVGVHRLTVGSPKVPELITPKQVRGLSSAEEKLLEVQREDSSIPVGRSKNPIKNAVEKTNKATERALNATERALNSTPVTAALEFVGGAARWGANALDTAALPRVGLRDVVMPRAPLLRSYSVPSKENPTDSNEYKNAHKVLLPNSAESQRFASGATRYLTGNDNFLSKLENTDLSRHLEKKRSEAGKVETLVYDLANTFGYQMPTMVSSLALGGAGGLNDAITMLTFGAAGFSSKLRDNLSNGKDPGNSLVSANVAAVIDGVVETLLGKAFGVTPKLGGRLSLGILSNFRNPVVRTIMSFLSESAQEGAEEVIQSLLNTAADRLILGDDSTVDWSQVTYEGLLGALSGGVFGSISLKNQISDAKKAYAADVDYINTISKNADALENASEAVEMIRALERQRNALVAVINSDDIADSKARAKYIDKMLYNIENLIQSKFSTNVAISKSGTFNEINYYINEGKNIESNANTVESAKEAEKVLNDIKEYNDATRESDSENILKIRNRLSQIELRLRDRYNILDFAEKTLYDISDEKLMEAAQNIKDENTAKKAIEILGFIKDNFAVYDEKKLSDEEVRYRERMNDRLSRTIDYLQKKFTTDLSNVTTENTSEPGTFALKEKRTFKEAVKNAFTPSKGEFQRSDDNAVIAIEARAAAVKDEAEARTVLDAIKGVREANALRGEIDAATVWESARMNERLSVIEKKLRARFGIEAPTEVSNDTEATAVPAESEADVGTVEALPEENSAPIEDEVELARATQEYVYDNTAAANETYNSAQLAGANPEQRAVAIELGQLFNKRVLFFSDPDRNVGGYYEPSKNAIYVNVNSPRATYSIIASEMTHALERTPEYDSIKKIVLKNFQEVERKSLDTLRKEKRKVYEAREGRKLSDEYIDQELCEEYIGKYLFSSSAHIQKFVRAAGVNSSNRFIQFFDGVIKAITRNNAVAKWIRTKLGDARMLWADAVNRVKSEGDNNTIAQASETRNSYEGVDEIDENRGNESENKKVEKIRYELLDMYTERQYNRNGWAYINNLIYGRATADFSSKVASISAGRVFPMTKDGFYIIAIGAEEGIDNILVYTDGNIDSPSIEEVVIIHHDNETEIDPIRREIYAREEHSNYETFSLIKKYAGYKSFDTYERSDFPSFRELTGRRRTERGSGGKHYHFDSGLQDGDTSVGSAEKSIPGNEIEEDRRYSYEGVDEIDENRGEESQEWEEDLAITERMRKNLEREGRRAHRESDNREKERIKEVYEQKNKIRRGFVSMADQVIAEEEKRLKENEEARAPIEEYEPRYRGGYKVTAQEISEEEADMLRGQAMTEEEYAMEEAAMSEEGYVSDADRAIAEEEKRIAENEEARAPLDKLYPEMFQTKASDAEPPAPGTAAAVGEAAAKKVLPPESTPEEIAKASERLAKEAEAIKEAIKRLESTPTSELIFPGSDAERAAALQNVGQLISRVVEKHKVSAPMQVLAKEIALGEKDVTHIPAGENKKFIMLLSEMYNTQDILMNQLPKNSALMRLGLKVESPLVVDYRSAPALRGIERIRRDNEQAAIRITRGLTKLEKEAAELIAKGAATVDQFNGIDKVAVSMVADSLSTLRSFDNAGVRAQRASTVERFDELLEMLVPAPEAAARRGNLSLQLNTMVRNNLDVFGEVVGARINENLFRPIVRNEAERMRFVNRENREFTSVFGKVTKDESESAQMFIEAGVGVKELAELDPKELVERFKSIAERLNVDFQSYEKELEGRTLSKKESRMLKSRRDEVSDAEAKYRAVSEALEKGLDVTRIANMADFFRAKYDLYYEAINDFLVVHGYEPIGFIKNYAPHMQEQNMERFSNILQRLGFQEGVFDLPVEIAGRTEFFKPGKKYNPHFRTRHGIATRLDALAGFDSYVRHLSEVLYHTDDIQKLRQFSQYLRTAMAEETIKEKVMSIREKMRKGEITEEEGNNQIDEELKKVKNTNLSPYVTILDDYANVIAGKQTVGDRGDENVVGRKYLNLANRLRQLFIRASIVGNISSAVNQTVQLPLVAAECGENNLAAAFADIATGKLNKEMEFDKRSTFITGKKGVTVLTSPNAWEKVLDKGMVPFELVDDVVSRVIVRAKYLQLIDQHVSPDTALVLADEYAESAIGSRMKGAKPMMFHHKSLFKSLFTTFQLEIANGWAHIVKDLPREFRNVERDRGRLSASGYLASFMIRYLVEAFVLNGLLDELYGQTPVQFDVIGYIVDGISAGFGLTRRGFIEALFTNALKGKEFDFLDAVAGSGKEVMEDVPFLQSAMALLGYGDSRLPLPSIQTDKIFKGLGAISDDDTEVKKKGFAQLGDGIWGTVKSFVPFGSQLNKTLSQGLGSWIKGGSYDYSGRLQYAVGRDPLSGIPALVFGTQAYNESNEFWAAGGQALSKKATDAYEELRKSGMKFNEAYSLAKEMSALQGDEKPKKEIDVSGMDPFEAMAALYFTDYSDDEDEDLQTKVEKQVELLDSVEGLTDEQKYISFKNLSADSKAADMMQYLAEHGVDYGEAYDVISSLAITKNTDDDPRAREEFLRNSDLTGWEKSFVYYNMLASKSERETAEALRDLNEAEPVIYEVLDDISIEGSKGGTGVTERKRSIVMNSDLSDDGKLAMYSRMFVSDAESGKKEQALMNELVKSGVDSGIVADVFSGLKDEGTDAGKCNVLLDSSLTNIEVEKVYLQRVVSDNDREKAQKKIDKVIDAGGNIRVYLKAYAAVSGLSWENGDWKKGESGGKSQAYKAAIDKVTSKVAIRRALYDIFEVSEKMW